MPTQKHSSYASHRVLNQAEPVDPRHTYKTFTEQHIEPTLAHMATATLEWRSGDDVEIEVPETPNRWRAVIVRVSSDNLHLRLTSEPQSGAQLSMHTAVQLRRITHTGLVSAPTTLSQSYQGFGLHLLVRRPHAHEVIQRRSLFRAPTALPLTVQVRQAARTDWVSRRVYHHLTADASGSGCSIETELPLAIGDRVRVTVWPDRPHAVVAGAKIVWTGTSDWPGLRRAGLSFTTISTVGQDRVVGALMEEERIRKRLFEQG